MAKSARELFAEAMKLAPEERATLMRLLIESIDVESEEVSRTRGGSRSSAGWPNWTQVRWRPFPGKSLERGCTAADSCRPPSGSTPLPRWRRKRRMHGTPIEILTLATAFARSCGTPSMRWPVARRRGLARDAVPADRYFPDSRSVLCTSSAATKSRSLPWLTRRDALATGARGSDRPSSIRMRRPALRAAADPARWAD